MAAAGPDRRGHPAWTGRVDIRPIPKDADAKSVEAALAAAAPGVARASVVSRTASGTVTVKYPTDRDAIAAMAAVSDATVLGARVTARWAAAAAYSFEEERDFRATERASFRAAAMVPLRVREGRLEALLAIETKPLERWEATIGLSPTALAIIGRDRTAEESPLVTAVQAMHEKTSAVMGPGGDEKLHSGVWGALARPTPLSSDTSAMGVWFAQSRTVVFFTRMGNVPAASSNGALRMAEAAEGLQVSDRAEPADFVAAAAATPKDDCVRLDRALCKARGHTRGGFLQGRALRWVGVSTLLGLVPEHTGKGVADVAPAGFGELLVRTATGDRHRVGHSLAMLLMLPAARSRLADWCRQAGSAGDDVLETLGRASCGGCSPGALPCLPS